MQLRKEFGDHEGKIIVNHDNIRYIVPFLLHYTPGSISVNQQNQELFFEINHPEKWSFAKISVTNSKDGETDTTTTTPNKKTSIEIYENAEYWIEANIRGNENTTSAFNTIKISSLPENLKKMEIVNIPEQQIGLIVVAIIIIGVFGLIKKKQYSAS